MIDADRSSDGLFSQMDFFPTLLRLAGADELVPDDRYIDGVDQTSFLLDPDGLSNRKYLFYWLGQTFSALRVGEWKFMLASTSDDDRDVLNLGGFSGVTPEVHLRQAVQPLPRSEGDAQLPDPQAGLPRRVPARDHGAPHELPRLPGQAGGRRGGLRSGRSRVPETGDPIVVEGDEVNDGG